MKISRIEDIVYQVLEKYPDARSDDFILIVRVYMAIKENSVVRNSFLDIMFNHKEYGLPSFHTITRTRRKVFEKHPELKPEKITKKREELEIEYKEYSKT